jgi:hypothetical protein
MQHVPLRDTVRWPVLYRGGDRSHLLRSTWINQRRDRPGRLLKIFKPQPPCWTTQATNALYPASAHTRASRGSRPAQPTTSAALIQSWTLAGRTASPRSDPACRPAGAASARQLFSRGRSLVTGDPPPQKGLALLDPEVKLNGTSERLRKVSGAITRLGSLMEGNNQATKVKAP